MGKKEIIIRIEKSSGEPIKSLADWAQLYDSANTTHQWKVGRSAHAIADFVLDRDGGNVLQSRVSREIEQDLVLDRVVPEYEVRFDRFGLGRVHDLAIFGKTGNGQTVFVGVEAKVDETFGPTVHDYYLAAKEKQITGTSTNAPKRVERLLSMHFTKPKISMFDVRYQLLYATAGTLAAGADVSVLYIAVFITDLYDKTIGASNHRDYLIFLSEIGAHPFPSGQSGENMSIHQISLQGKNLICMHEYFRQ